MNFIHVWEKYEIKLYAQKEYANPYTDVEVWVDLIGADFNKRVYGFWNGGNEFCVRVTAKVSGEWKWTSGSNQNDEGLVDKMGSYTAIEWTEEEKIENPNRRGMIVAAENGHAFEYSDGTPFILCGDTWWSLGTWRFHWYDDEEQRPLGIPETGFKDMVRSRKQQGYNGIAMIAAFPTWANDDGFPSTIQLDDEEKTTLRAAWQEDGTSSITQRGTKSPALSMHNEGGRAFLFPGKVPGYENVVPDFNQINPDYFEYVDRKIDYLNDNGFVVFIEVSRRDMSMAWKKFYDWPESYARYIQYIYTRYQANICMFSPIHFDTKAYSIPSRELNEAANLVLDKYGPPPFDTLQGTNASPSTLINFGDPNDARWLTFHQIGNWRNHDDYWYLTEIYNSAPPRPAINGEPYYSGYPFNEPDAYSIETDLNNRSGIYGSFLSGGFGGIFHAAMGLFRGNIEGCKYRMWDALLYPSGWHLPYLKSFALVEGTRYRALIPNAELITPNKSGPAVECWREWAFCAATKNKDFVLGYLEYGCPDVTMRSLRYKAKYRLRWFNPRTGEWTPAAKSMILETDEHERLKMPRILSYRAKEDWGFCLTLIEG